MHYTCWSLLNLSTNVRIPIELASLFVTYQTTWPYVTRSKYTGLNTRLLDYIIHKKLKMGGMSNETLKFRSCFFPSASFPVYLYIFKLLHSLVSTVLHYSILTAIDTRMSLWCYCRGLIAISVTSGLSQSLLSLWLFVFSLLCPWSVQ
jgi:hypothetical protein